MRWCLAAVALAASCSKSARALVIQQPVFRSQGAPHVAPRRVSLITASEGFTKPAFSQPIITDSDISTDAEVSRSDAPERITTTTRFESTGQSPPPVLALSDDTAASPIILGQPSVSDGAVSTDSEVQRGDAPPRKTTTTPIEAGSPAPALATTGAESLGSQVILGQPTISDSDISTDSEVIRGDAPERITTTTRFESTSQSPPPVIVLSDDTAASPIILGQPSVSDGAVSTDSEVQRGDAPPRKTTTTPIEAGSPAPALATTEESPASRVILGQPTITDSDISTDSEVHRDDAPPRTTIMRPRSD